MALACVRAVTAHGAASYGGGRSRRLRCVAMCSSSREQCYMRAYPRACTHVLASSQRAYARCSSLSRCARMRAHIRVRACVRACVRSCARVLEERSGKDCVSNPVRGAARRGRMRAVAGLLVTTGGAHAQSACACVARVREQKQFRERALECASPLLFPFSPRTSSARGPGGPRARSAFTVLITSLATHGAAAPCYAAPPCARFHREQCYMDPYPDPCTHPAAAVRVHLARASVQAPPKAASPDQHAGPARSAMC